MYHLQRSYHFAFILLLLPFLGSDCREEPVQPCTDCPQPIDTTSHNFTWQIDTLGDGNSSTLYDVAVVNDTLAYAVGEIYLRDSLTGRYDPNSYNLARWNGKNWELKRVLVRDYGTGTGYFPLYAIFAFSENDIWFASDADLIHWDGIQFTAKAFFMTQIPFTGQVRKMWGTSASNLYCVGLGGAIYHYNGTTWQKLESGTTLPIQDVWGSKNSQTGETEILAIASNGSFGEGKKLLSIKNNSVFSLPDSGLPSFGLYGLWFEPNKRYFAVGAGIFYKDNAYNTARWETAKNITTYYTIAMRGTGMNNIIAAGAFGDVWHYNGTSWKQYSNLKIDGSYITIDVKAKTIALCGYTATRGAIVIGKQQ